MPKFFLACRVRAAYHIEIVAKNPADAKRKAEASIIPGMVSPHNCVLHAASLSVSSKQSSKAAITSAAGRISPSVARG